MDTNSGTVLFAGYPKTVFESGTGAYKIRYYNDTALVITDLTT